MLRALRAQVQEQFAGMTLARRPALRRSDAPDALLATDLPQVADEAALMAFCREMACLGWRCVPNNGWLLLDAPVPAPDALPPAVPDGACGCCISLLLRHPDHADASEDIRRVVKAADAGSLPFERLCKQLHGEFAIRLRQGKPLPGALLPYLCQAWHDIYEEGKL